MAPFQQRGGGSNSSTLAHHGDMLSFPSRWLPHDICQSLNSVFAPYRNRTLSLSSTSTVPSSPASAYDFGNAANSRNHLPSSSIGPSSHASAYDFETSSGNAANSSGTSSIGPSSYVNGSNSRLGYGDYLPPVHLQGTSPSVWRAQGEDSYRSIPPRGQQEREAYFERIRTDLASSSLDQTQQRPKDE
ncbi:uncharacterized protein LOC130510669 [Raphanus sativus]|uniref:Uncharacterized protein LOC130510669 n=1 Tax=Raphanus sativus TaxID=3726 RepID=A0A9W3DHB0_RAPSA|nr:uncharacterized protein LOC130510669 [Raphanus sativus]